MAARIGTGLILGLLALVGAPGCGRGGGGGGDSGGTTVASFAQESNQNSPMGINFNILDYWNSELCFQDIFKQSGDWIPQGPNGNPWNTQQPFAGFTPDGYPLLNSGQTAGTLMCRGLQGHYPAGTYNCYYDGTGSITFGLDATIVSQSPGHIVINVTPANLGIYLRINSTSPSDPIRNIRVIMPGFDSTYQSQVFTPQFLSRWSQFKCLRFVHWMKTINSTAQNWLDRPTPTWFSQASYVNAKGVCLEYMIQLCNTLHADAWFCLPHLASDDYLTQFAAMVRDNLDPTLKAYVEYSNECWNGQYTETQFCRQQGTVLGLSSDPHIAGLRFYSQQSVHLFNIWQQIFGGTSRFVRVLAAQHDTPATGTTVMDWQSASSHADAFATAPYFGIVANDSNQATIATWTVQQVLDASANEYPTEIQFEATNYSNAAARGLPLISYEGGQSLMQTGSAMQNTTITNLFAAANRDPQMGTIHTNYLNALRGAGGRLYMHFCSTAKYGPYGYFGAMEWDDQTTSPKYAALLNFIQNNPQWW